MPMGDSCSGAFVCSQPGTLVPLAQATGACLAAPGGGHLTPASPRPSYTPSARHCAGCQALCWGTNRQREVLMVFF